MLPAGTRMAWPRYLFGLPLHPMLVHVPLAFWLSVPVFDAMALYDHRLPWLDLALGLTGAGVVIGVLALATGLLEYIHLSETGSSDVRLAARHGVRTTVVWCAMTIKLAVAPWLPTSRTLAVTCLVVDLLACALLLQGAFFGTAIAYGGYRRRRS